MSLVIKHGKRKRVLLALGCCSSAVHRGIVQYARDVDWILDEAFVRDRMLIPGWDGNGMIADCDTAPEIDHRVMNIHVPQVNIGQALIPGVPSVAMDNRAIGRMAAEHFLQRGFRNFAFYSYSHHPDEVQKLRGFEAEVGAAGGKLGLIELDPSRRANRFEHIACRLEALNKPLAVFADSDDRAIEVLDAAISRRLRVPEQVAVLGVNNDELRCPFAPVPLSSIETDEERLGFEAARLLERGMAGQVLTAEPMLIAPRAVMTRQSTNILAIPHEDVAMALRLVWEHYREPIDAMRIAQEVPLSYPQLHAQFVRYVGHSMAQEIMARRLEHARTLLTESDVKIADVARQSGFGSADRLGRVFMRELKMTPSEYRQKHTLREMTAQSNSARSSADRKH